MKDFWLLPMPMNSEKPTLLNEAALMRSLLKNRKISRDEGVNR